LTAGNEVPRSGLGGLGFGIAVDTDRRVLRTVVRTVARLGYRSLWVNTGDGEQADGLSVLREAHEIAPELALGVGVIALHRLQPAQIAERVLDSGLPLGTLYLGIGSGTAAVPVARPLARVRAALGQIRAELPGSYLVIAALGPAMCRLGGEAADGVLLNWMPPSGARSARGEIDRGRLAHHRPGPGPAVFGYVRAASGPDAAERIAFEAEHYRRAGAHYERNAARVGSWSGGLDLDSPSVGADLRSYADALDHVILRALPGGTSAAELEQIAATGMHAFRRSADAAGPGPA
jgi:alkanesulfonate monooxygenase SsuD/methylene tetrahydromethanopterin reductase-like flavin-dependent oxidoreductase (luciferase family)